LDFTKEQGNTGNYTLFTQILLLNKASVESINVITENILEQYKEGCFENNLMFRQGHVVNIFERHHTFSCKWEDCLTRNYRNSTSSLQMMVIV